MEPFRDMLKKNILYTIAFYDCLNYPLTPLELREKFICKFGKVQKSSILEIERSLSSLEEFITKKDGLICLKGSEKLVGQRVRNQKIALAKLRRVKRWMKWLVWVPFLKGVFVTGTLGMKNSEKGSDWDVWVITAKGRIWLGRLFFTLILMLFGKKRDDKKIKDRFCLNHFLAMDGLELTDKNEFSASEISFSIPVYDEFVHRQFIKENHHWAKEVMPNFLGLDQNRHNEFLVIRFPMQEKIKKVFEFTLENTLLARALNNWAKERMVKRIKENPKTYQQGADVVYNDKVLKFLPEPRQKLLEKRALEKMKDLNPPKQVDFGFLLKSLLNLK